jgi:hypothetical protein
MRVRSIICAGLFLAGTGVVFTLDAFGGPLLQVASGIEVLGLRAGWLAAGVLPSPLAGLPLLGAAALIALRARRDVRGR